MKPPEPNPDTDPSVTLKDMTLFGAIAQGLCYIAFVALAVLIAVNA